MKVVKYRNREMWKDSKMDGGVRHQRVLVDENRDEG